VVRTKGTHINASEHGVSSALVVAFCSGGEVNIAKYAIREAGKSHIFFKLWRVTSRNWTPKSRRRACASQRTQRRYVQQKGCVFSSHAVFS
jgi:hypothetical protein